MKKLILVIIFQLFIINNICFAFTNSLDNNSQPQNTIKQNNFTTPNKNSLKNIQNTPLNPKTHSGFEHQDRQFPEPSMNDTRYNSNCQFGVCTPGGI